MKKTVFLAIENEKSFRTLKDYYENCGWIVFPKAPLYVWTQEAIDSYLKEFFSNAPPLDMLICEVDDGSKNDAVTIEDNMDFLKYEYEYDKIAIKAVRIVHSFLPLLEKGDVKRISFITSKDSSNNLCGEESGYGRRMALSAVNMFVNQLFNLLRPKGYSFRMYCADGCFDYAGEYFSRNRSYEEEDYKHSDENRVVLRDAFARELPW